MHFALSLRSTSYSAALRGRLCGSAVVCGSRIYSSSSDRIPRVLVQFTFASFIIGLALVAAWLQPAAAQEQSPFVLRIVELDSSGRYTCTELTADPSIRAAHG